MRGSARRFKRTVRESSLTDRALVLLAILDAVVGAGVVYVVTSNPAPTTSAGPRFRPSDAETVDHDDTPITKVKLASAMKKLKNPSAHSPWRSSATRRAWTPRRAGR